MPPKYYLDIQGTIETENYEGSLEAIYLAFADLKCKPTVMIRVFTMNLTEGKQVEVS